MATEIGTIVQADRDFVIVVDGERLSARITKLDSRAVRRYAIEIQHIECGDRASFEVIDFRGYALGQETGDAPSSVRDAVRAIVTRMDDLWKSADVRTQLDAPKAFGLSVFA